MLKIDFPNDLIDLHMHTTVSDGTDSPAEILARVKAAGIRLFSVTDHDGIKGAVAVTRLLKPGDPAFICGAEFSCKDGLGKYHILGYGYRPASVYIKELIELGHSLRIKKVRARLDFLNNEFGFVFPQKELDALLKLDNPGKPHIGLLMVKYGFAESKEDAIINYIDKLHLRSEYVAPDTAIRLILKSGGIPVLAHPAYGSGDQIIMGDELRERVQRLKGMGLKGLECYYSGFSPKITRELLALAEQEKLYVTAGSDYHGRNKIIDLGDVSAAPIENVPKGMTGFFNDARIIVKTS